MILFDYLILLQRKIFRNEHCLHRDEIQKRFNGTFAPTQKKEIKAQRRRENIKY